jgi:hypothetical protein
VECYPEGIYRPRNAQATGLYHLVEDNFDELVRVWCEALPVENQKIALLRCCLDSSNNPIAQSETLTPYVILPGPRSPSIVGDL